MKRIGTRLQVMRGIAKQTGGGLRKKDLKYNKYGKIISKKVSIKAKKAYYKQSGGNKDLFKLSLMTQMTNYIDSKFKGKEIEYFNSRNRTFKILKPRFNNLDIGGNKTSPNDRVEIFNKTFEELKSQYVKRCNTCTFNNPKKCKEL